MDPIRTPSSSLRVSVTPVPFRTPSPFSVVDSTETQRLIERRIHGKTWQLIGSPVNIYRKLVRSAIWNHGSLYHNINSVDEKRWICDLCPTAVALPPNRSTFNVSRHLLDAHKINVKRNREEAEEDEEETPQDEEDSQRTGGSGGS